MLIFTTKSMENTIWEQNFSTAVPSAQRTVIKHVFILKNVYGMCISFENLQSKSPHIEFWKTGIYRIFQDFRKIGAENRHIYFYICRYPSVASSEREHIRRPWKAGRSHFEACEGCIHRCTAQRLLVGVNFRLF